ncbi:regulator of nonsense transcripts 2-like isoform X2 [Orbicella faveolata]|uniref:regulator of nonsense transcripts 2-like isoform X2 n=1 Tax=Orbicella faveolata TaxID=48498 RepID=UPI0009E1F6F4|nr:regulator of nonsense transcripts 2-like isoform X2 [Orbicella faveolata]
MNEEKSKAECGEAEQISGGKKCVVRNCTREAVESSDKVKKEKAQNFISPTPENETGTSMEKAKSEEEMKAAINECRDDKDTGNVDSNKGKEEEDEEELRKEEEEMKQSLKEAQEWVEQKLAMREKNLAAIDQRPEESYFKGKDSSVKKNSAFIKKLRTITESQRESLEQEFAGLNLSRYVQEAVAAMVDGLVKLKLADVRCVAHICGLIHQVYADFSEPLKKGLLKMFDGYGGKEEEKLANVSKYRVTLRLLGELIIGGVFPKLPEGIKILSTILSNIVNCDKESHVYVQVISSFARHCGEDFAGITSRKQRLMAEKHKVVFPKCAIVPAEDQAAIQQLLLTYYKSLANHLLKAHKDLQNREKQNRQTLMTKGELHPERKEAFEKAQKAYEKLLANTSSLADILDVDMPDLPQDEFVQQEAGGSTIDVFNPFRHSEYDGSSGLWEDEETRIFYENLRDLKSFLPGILYKDEGKEEDDDTTNSAEDEKLDIHDMETEEEFEEVEDDIIDEELNEKESEEEDDESSSGETSSSSTGLALEAILVRLPTCVNKEFIDEVATEFMQTCNTKGNRKKLCRALFGVPRIRLDLLPMYARLVATLDPCAPDLSPELMQQLKGEFRFRVRKKDQINLESKIKTVRFIGELTKFNMFPKGEALHCLKMLLEDFTHHNIEMACSLLEVCGRFLYRSEDSHIRTKNLLELMMRKKAVQNLDSRQLTLIENAFFYCNPPEKQKVSQKERPPMHEYIRKLLYKDLSKTTTEKVLRQIRKLPWNEPQTALYVIKCLIRVWNIKYNSIHCAANLLAGIVQYYEDVGLYVVDGVLEEIRLGMETNLQKMNQRRVSCVKFLGELYTYRQVESRVIFSTLYSFITFGNNQEGVVSVLDPPEHLFRIRLICTLLDTCGQYFDHGNYKKKLDCFLVYFQCYILKKKADPIWNEGHPFPRDVDYMVADTLESLRPKLTMYTSLDQAVESLQKLNKEHQEQIEKAAPVDQDTHSPGSSSTQPLPTPNISYSKVLSESPAVSLSNSPCQSPMLREEDEHSETGESEGEDEDDVPGPQWAESEREVTEVDINDVDMNKVKVLSPPKPEPTVEDRAFLAALDKLLVDDVQTRREENPKVPSLDVAVPMHLKGQRARHNSLSEESENLNFVVMLKKGNKQQFKDLQIPLSSGLAANIRDRQMAEQQEQEEVKRLVLDYNQRQEEEIYNEMQAQQRQAGSDQSSRSHGHRFNRRRLPEGNDTNIVFANLTRRR